MDKRKVRSIIIGISIGILSAGMGAGAACAITLKKTSNNDIVDEQYYLSDLKK
jgi:hypothetical protein